MSNPLPIPLVVMSGWRTDARPDHQGIDLAADEGTPVLAVRSGRVKLVTGDTGNTGPGCSIIIQHTADDETRYNHLLHRPMFRVGSRVAEAEQLGQVGMTGKTDAEHLHFARYRFRGGRWRDVDPTTLLDFSSTAGGDDAAFDPEEDDMYTEADRRRDERTAARVDAIYAGVFGSRNLTGKADEISWENIDGDVQKSRYGLLPIAIHNQDLIARTLTGK